MVYKIIKIFGWGIFSIVILLNILLFTLKIANGGNPGPCKHYPCSTDDTSYVNRYGDEVSMPVYTDEQPEDATARCRNGSYSFSQHRSGTCSREGGVDEWL